MKYFRNLINETKLKNNLLNKNPQVSPYHQSKRKKKKKLLLHTENYYLIENNMKIPMKNKKFSKENLKMYNVYYFLLKVLFHRG